MADHWFQSSFRALGPPARVDSVRERKSGSLWLVDEANRSISGRPNMLVRSKNTESFSVQSRDAVDCLDRASDQPFIFPGRCAADRWRFRFRARRKSFSDRWSSEGDFEDPCLLMQYAVDVLSVRM